MNVMAGSGLVGRVVDVGSNWSKVKSIIADDSNVAAMVLSNSDQMIVSGNLEEYSNGSVTFSQLSDTENKVKVGDKVLISKYGGTEIKQGKDTFLVLRQDDILAVIK